MAGRKKEELSAQNKTEAVKQRETGDEEQFSIEESFRRLEETLQLLESDGISLEDSLKAYEEGMKYVRRCNAALDEAEKKVLLVRGNGETEEFEQEER